MPDFKTDYIVKVARVGHSIVHHATYSTRGAAVAAAHRCDQRPNLLVLDVCKRRTEIAEIPWESELIDGESMRFKPVIASDLTAPAMHGIHDADQMSPEETIIELARKRGLLNPVMNFFYEAITNMHDELSDVRPEWEE